MARDLVPLKIKIGLKRNGHALYPDFNSLNEVRKSGYEDWSKYIDVMGSGWFYDTCCGHGEDSQDSPNGQQWGVLLVPKKFVVEAVANFPDTCSQLTEAELETFYDNHAASRISDVDVDEKALQPFVVREQLGVRLTPEEETAKAKAIDPDDPTPGLKRNKQKRWTDLKASRGYNIVQ